MDGRARVLKEGSFKNLGAILDDRFARRKGKIGIDGRDVPKGNKLTEMSSLLGGVKDAWKWSPC